MPTRCVELGCHYMGLFQPLDCWVGAVHCWSQCDHESSGFAVRGRFPLGYPCRPGITEEKLAGGAPDSGQKRPAFQHGSAPPRRKGRHRSRRHCGHIQVDARQGCSVFGQEARVDADLLRRGCNHLWWLVQWYERNVLHCHRPLRHHGGDLAQTQGVDFPVFRSLGVARPAASCGDDVRPCGAVLEECGTFGAGGGELARRGLWRLVAQVRCHEALLWLPGPNVGDPMRSALCLCSASLIMSEYMP
mmetsp:Transcript_38260/g.123067  ORF Transcript_38260/g.123067 Transcript_38260/m.123067 type:complete len:246 (-) Transcript_38260:108-845(-)